ncbi:MAG: hypothetical protein ABJA60_06605, partial [Nitrosospira sp.]
GRSWVRLAQDLKKDRLLKTHPLPRTSSLRPEATGMGGVEGRQFQRRVHATDKIRWQCLRALNRG